MKISFVIILTLLGISQVNAQKSATIGGVFDFEVGDEFHTEHAGSPIKGERVKVLAKNWSENKDTVFYTFFDFGYTSDYDHERTPKEKFYFRADTIEKIYTHLDSSIFTYKLDELLPDSNFIYYKMGDWIEENKSDSGITAIVDTVSEHYPVLCKDWSHVMKVYQKPFNSMLTKYTLNIFSKGLGVINHYDGSSGSYMIYYKKGETECGTPDLRASAQFPIESNLIKVYPNPTNGELHIWSGNHHGPFEIKIFDLNGKLTLQSSSQNQDHRLSISNFPKGLYVIEISNHELTHRQKIILE